MEETTNKFIIDTQKFCFMCLHNGSNGRPGPASITAAATTRFSFSMKQLTRFLKVDLQKVFNINMTPSNSSRNLLDETDILVSLCKVCFVEATKFDQLYQELRQIERRIQVAVRTIHQLMAAGESNPVLVESFNQRMKSTNPFELIQKNITENFRKETIEKLCFSGSSNRRGRTGALAIAGASNVLQTIRPGSSGSGFNGLHQSQSRSHLTTPSLMARRPHPQLQEALARGPLSSGSRIKMKRPLILRGEGGISAKVPALLRPKPPIPPLRRVISANSSNNSSVEPRPKKMNKNEVPCVDLDSDPEENSSDLVINSVSSVNGITITYPGSSSSSTSTLSDYQQQLQNQRFNGLEITPCSSASVTYGHEGGFGATNATITTSGAGTGAHYYGMTQNPNPNLDFDTTNLLEETQRQQTSTSTSAKVFVQCIHCQQKFTTNSGLRNHILATHRAELFAQFKKPEKTNEEFKEALDKVFSEYGEKNGDTNCWPCLFCEKRLGYKHTAEAHMIQSHFDNISEMLVAWQDGAISLTPEQIFKLRQSRRNLSSSELISDAILQEALNGSGSDFASAAAPATMAPVHEVTVPNIPSTSTGVTIKQENDGSLFKCKICDKGFNDAVSLEGHTLIKHSTDTSALASTATYSCAHCQKRFSYYHVQRVHVFTRHRTEELSKHLPKDTPVDEIEAALTPILNNYVKLETGKKYGCSFSPCTREFSHTEYTMLQNHVWLCHFEELLTRLKAAISEREGKNKSINKKEVEVGRAATETGVKGPEAQGPSQNQTQVKKEPETGVKGRETAGDTVENNSSKRVKTEPLEQVEPLTNANANNSSSPSHSHPPTVTKIEAEPINTEPVVNSMLEILPDLE